jgi:hypothetical protein
VPPSLLAPPEASTSTNTMLGKASGALWASMQPLSGTGSRGAMLHAGMTGLLLKRRGLRVVVLMHVPETPAASSCVITPGLDRTSSGWGCRWKVNPQVRTL